MNCEKYRKLTAILLFLRTKLLILDSIKRLPFLLGINKYAKDRQTDC